jgi:PIN domain nuclease of toxin-antitoxin system
MRILLDTHILLWALLNPSRLAPLHRDLLVSPEHQVFFSAVNIWEIAIKRALDRPDFDVEPDVVREAGIATDFRELPITGIHAAMVRQLENHRRDPFDRLLVAQAKTEPMRLMTDDPLIALYPVERI